MLFSVGQYAPELVNVAFRELRCRSLSKYSLLTRWRVAITLLMFSAKCTNVINEVNANMQDVYCK